MPNFSGIWNATEQFQARAQNIWPATPGAPTIGTATAGGSNCASVAFTAPACTGRFPAGVTNYTAISTPGCVTVTGASSPVVVTGLTTGTSYTFRVRANGANGSGPLSAASNSITATVATCATYTTAGSYTWVAPAGVTSVAAIAVGGGGRGAAAYCVGCAFRSGAGGGGGGLAYRNAHSVTPGTSYSLVVGAQGGVSWFVNQSTVLGVNGGGEGFDATQGQGGTVISGTGGRGGVGGTRCSAGGGGAGGGAGGYSGEGGAANTGAPSGGGGGGGRTGNTCRGGGGGGGVGIFGAGTSGATPPALQGSGGFGGSGGNNGNSTTVRSGAAGGSPGGGGGGAGTNLSGCTAGFRGSGACGAVRIVWAVAGVRCTPSFPSTNVGP